MALGLDSYRPDIVAKDAKQLFDLGYRFVVSYLFDTSAFKHHLTKSLAKLISDAGLYNVVVFENGRPTSDAYFNGTQGVKDALIALAQATAAGVPKGYPVYFAVDYDPTANAKAKILDYFRHVSPALRQTGYKVGCYGSGYILQVLLDAGLIDYAWLSQSTGFQGYHEFLASGRANIIQGPVSKVLDIDVDIDHSTALGGGGWIAT